MTQPPDSVDVVPYAGQTRVGPDDVFALWTTSGGLSGSEARRRLSELVVVAIGPGDELLGASSAYVAYSERLRVNLWHVRVLVAERARLANTARRLSKLGCDILRERYVSGVETHALGALIEIENQEVREYMTAARLPATGYEYIGEDALGRHLRVIYFPGAELPAPG